MPARKRGRTEYRGGSTKAARTIQRMYRAKRSRRFTRPKKPLALKMHNFVERLTTDYTLQVAKNTTISVMHGKSFSLDEIRQAAQYKDLFEYYRINKVVATFRYKSVGPVANQSMTATATQYVLPNEINPQLIFKIDHNDVAAQTIDAMKESARTKVKVLTNNGSEFSIQFKPAILAESYKTAISTAYAPKWGQWLATTDSNVPHYGLKVHCLGTDYIENNGAIELTYKVYFSCKCNE